MADSVLAISVFREERRDDADWVIEWLVEDQPEAGEFVSRLSLQQAVFDLPDIPLTTSDILVEKTPDENWLEKTYQEFAPFSVGPFYIYGSHYEGDVPEEQTGLQIDATTAFGSGEHGTTKGCLQAMLELDAKGVCPWNILDMGTGSGILALAAWKLWKAPVLAVDNDDESVRVTERHADMNGVKIGKSMLTTGCGDGFKTPIVSEQKPYELIVMNILAGPVIEMAPEAHLVLDDNGYIVLSGMLNDQADLVASAYEGLGLTLSKRYDIGEWTTLVMHNPMR